LMQPRSRQLGLTKLLIPTIKALLDILDLLFLWQATSRRPRI
jgi:hypothetical protein